jgi:hypothetical protein
VKGDGKPGAATSGTPGLGGRVQATCFPQGGITRCALTSLLLASALSERQDTAAYLRVLAKALRNYGAPEAIVTDSGGVFYSKRAMAIYEALDIRKERIDPRQSWQNYIEAHLYVMWNLENSHITCIMWTCRSIPLIFLRATSGNST